MLLDREAETCVSYEVRVPGLPDHPLLDSYAHLHLECGTKISSIINIDPVREAEANNKVDLIEEAAHEIQEGVIQKLAAIKVAVDGIMAHAARDGITFDQRTMQYLENILRDAELAAKSARQAHNTLDPVKDPVDLQEEKENMRTTNWWQKPVSFKKAS